MKDDDVGIWCLEYVAIVQKALSEKKKTSGDINSELCCG
jgi:hypothetical protein